MQVAAAARDRILQSSPTLRRFQLNPFRVFRLDVDTPVERTGYEVERALTRMRGGLVPETADPLPWLAEPEAYEVQRAAQRVEEPISRLVEQLLWFDWIRDPEGEALTRALAEPSGGQVEKYLGAEKLLLDECVEAGDDSAQAAAAHAINQANLRLLLVGFRAAFGLPAADVGSEVESVEKDRSLSEWQDFEGLELVAGPHALVAAGGRQRELAETLQRHWGDGLERWSHILGHPWFHAYLAARIEALEDDFVSADDVEAIEKVMRTQLADLTVMETRHHFMAGRRSVVDALVSSAPRLNLDESSWMLAFRPLRHLFQAELDEIGRILDSSAKPELADIDLYLNRLDVLTSSWKGVDVTGLIGLSSVVEGALDQAFGKITQLGPVVGPDEVVEGVLTHAAALAPAASLRQRIEAYLTRYRERRKHLCFYCQELAPEFSSSVVLSGKKETHRTYSFNTTTIHYVVTKGIIPRCTRCASYHSFLKNVGRYGGSSSILIFAGLTALALFWASDHPDPDAAGCFGVLFLILVLVGGPIATGGILRSTIASAFTPRGHRKYSAHSEAEPYQELLRDGYNVTVDWSENATSSLSLEN